MGYCLGGIILLLDLKKNELVFSGVGNTTQFSNSLGSIKGIKYRMHKGKFYVPLTYFQESRRALRDYKDMIQISASYEHFAKRFVIPKDGVHITWSPAVCKVQGGPIPFDVLIPATSYFNKAAINSPSYKHGIWDGMVHLFDVAKGEFPSGLIERFIEALNSKGTPFTIEQTFSYPKPEFKLNPVFSFTPTEDQYLAVDALDKWNNGIAKLPTGFGKTSFVAAELIARKGVKSMFLANQRVLIYDAKKDFTEVFGDTDVEIGIIGDGEFNPADITVASIQGVVAALTPPTELERNQLASELQLAKFRLKNNPDDEAFIKNAIKLEKKMVKMKEKIEKSYKIKEFLKTVQLFIVDESQVLGTDMWNKFLYACPAPYRYTLSATDTRTDGGRIQIVAATGERRFESSASEQIEKGRLSEFMGFYQKFDHGLDKDVMRELQMDYHQAYNLFIVNNDERNSFLCDWVIKWSGEGNSVLALVTRREHGERIQEMLINKGMSANDFAYVDGQSAKKYRNETIEAFREGKFPVLIGTSIFDVGFNAKNASKVVRFNAGGSEVRETQRAGRTVRKREDNSRGESIDLIDINVPFFEAQGWKRMKLIKEEFGEDRVKILPGVIHAPFDVVRLNDIVEAIPVETDREAGERVIQELLIRRGVIEVEEAPNYDEVENDKDLMSLLAELNMEEPM